MHKTADEAVKFVEAMNERVKSPRGIEVVICPPFVHLPVLHETYPKLRLGAQNCGHRDTGAFTGEVSPLMLKPYVDYVILGHSERRLFFGETNEQIAEKVRAAVVQKLQVILCVGETGEQKTAGQTMTVISEQLRSALSGLQAADLEHIIIAYEPVWAISTMPGATGESDEPESAQVVHKLIKKNVGEIFSQPEADISVLYGGSVKPATAEALLKQPDIDGALVGGASLDVDDFCDIIETAVAAHKTKHAA